nr:hypothetical protein [Tanacetum cinerariifolium]
METMIKQQVVLDEALVPSIKRHSLLLQMYQKFTCRNSRPHLMFINTPSDSKWTTKKNIVDLETFRDMLYISLRVPGQSFDELLFEEDILDLLWFLGHSAQIKTLTDVNVNKLCQPWRSFAAVINKCLTGKSSSFDSFRVMNDEIRNSKAYKKYYACATGEAAPKPKASAKRKRSGSDTSITYPTAMTTPTTTAVAAPRLTVAAKGKQPAKQKVQLTPQSTDKGTGSKPGVLDLPSDDSKEEISWNSSDDEDVDAQDKDR